ncbi:unnamed protein product [Rotaria sordida]|uniref:Serpin domain-containing protein n=2 Tax=Rotaria sordida TaxID=392033 RepID=A0A813SKD1_9BILA|nr:unnamed protein product [Rotaria sordida]CAF3836321.1 unnamed protein product [Rotaria sordida]
MIENNDNILEFPLRLSKICLLSIRDDNTFISPIAIEAAFHALSFNNKRLKNNFNKKIPFDFHNYFILNQDSIQIFHENLNEETIKYFNTEFQIHNLNDIEQRKFLLNQIIKLLTDQSLISILPSQKILEQIIVEPMTLLSCCSFVFRPFKIEYWKQLWSLKFHSNIHLSIETEFYYTKGFFHVAFHDTFHKIEILGQVFNGIQMKLIILLPQCSSDLIHLYANIKEYLTLPVSSAYIAVCIPNISMDIHINLIESLKFFNDLYNKDHLGELNQEIHLSAAHSIGHFALDMSTDKIKQSSSNCLHSIDLSPTTPWVFFANRPFLFLITYDDYYLLIGQMLGPKIRQETKKFSSKIKR